MKKVILLNDTSLFNAHFGCQLVGQSFRENFARSKFELLASLPLQFDPAQHTELFRKADLLVVNGEGSVHRGRNSHLVTLAADFPVAFVNCVYQGNPFAEALTQCRFIAARESMSAAEIQRMGAQAHIVPDMIFDALLLNSYVKEAPTEDLGITDSVLDTSLGFGPKPALVADYLKELCRYRRIATGRYHAAVSCMVLGIPFCAWPSNTWKIEGMMQDAGFAELCAPTHELAIERCPTSFPSGLAEYAEQARKRIRWMFDALLDC